MSARLRWLLLSPLAVAALFGLAWWAVDHWLESAGGRGAVERALGRAVGAPVSLSGEFGVVLLPRIGVGGTDLMAGDPADPGRAFAVAREYGVELALLPLLRGELLIDSVRLQGGRVDLARWPLRQDVPSGDAAGRRLTVRELLLRDIGIAGLGATELTVTRLYLTDFSPGAETPFELEVQEFGRLDGRFRWQPAPGSLELDGQWSGWLPGTLQLRVAADLEAARGEVEAAWLPMPEGARATFDATLVYALREGGVRLERVALATAGQAVSGSGCVRYGDGGRLDLDLVAESLDADFLPDWPELPAGAAGDGAGPELRVRLAVAEFRAAGALARGAEFGIGGPPDCGGLE